MNKLGARNYTLISGGVKTLGTYDPDKILSYFEEELYINQIEEIIDFLNWVHKNKLGFGSGNYEQVFKKFKDQNKRKYKKYTEKDFDFNKWTLTETPPPPRSKIPALKDVRPVILTEAEFMKSLKG